MDWTVRDDPDQGRYEIAAGDAVGGFITYTIRDDVMTMVHTEVDSSHEGEGLGSALVRDALDDARSRRLAVVPTCDFVRSFIDRHEEYVDLVPPVRRAELGLG